LFDINGLVESTRTDLAEFQKPFAHQHAPCKSFVDAINAIKPNGIVGVSTVPKLFNQAVIEAMSKVNAQPIIFPYSNPTSRSECTAEEAYKWSNGKAIFASGSPFDPVTLGAKTFVPGQGNNVYIFPAMGMAVLATQSKRVTQQMFIVAAKAVAASLHTAAKVATYIFDQGLARVERPKDIAAHIKALAYKPVYGD
jgi:malate dehydrogenase (oxaloacetate-decarboxylating)(NADP+)